MCCCSPATLMLGIWASRQLAGALIPRVFDAALLEHICESIPLQLAGTAGSMTYDSERITEGRHARPNCSALVMSLFWGRRHSSHLRMLLGAWGRKHDTIKQRFSRRPDMRRPERTRTACPSFVRRRHCRLERLQWAPSRRLEFSRLVLVRSSVARPRSRRSFSYLASVGFRPIPDIAERW